MPILKNNLVRMNRTMTDRAMNPVKNDKVRKEYIFIADILSYPREALP